jgi:hypothetical protein
MQAPHNPPTAQRSLRIRVPVTGFTVLELVVVTSILALLASLLLVGVQAARETSRSTKCKNNLRQLGLGLGICESSHGRFPSFYIGYHKGGFNGGALEQVLLTMSYALDAKQVGLMEWYPPFKPANDVAVLSCPSDETLSGTNYRCNTGDTVFAASSRILMEDGGNGSFDGVKELTAGDFAGGLSHAVTFSERLKGNGLSKKSRSLAYVPAWNGLTTQSAIARANGFSAPEYQYPGRTVLRSTVLHASYNHALQPNNETRDMLFVHDALSSNTATSLVSARSLHPSGVNAVLADGSVHFYGDSVALDVWRALGRR